MPRYRWLGANDTEIPDAGLVVQEGQEFESPVELNHPHAELVDPAKKKAGGKPDPKE